MRKKTGINATFYEENCLVDEFIEAEHNGDLLRPSKGKNAIEVMREHISAKKKIETSYIREALEVRVGKR